jgi:membrane peptidoglycan carboxypeptidase
MFRIRWRHVIPPGALLCVALLAYVALVADLPDPGQMPGKGGATAPSILITDRNGRPLYEVIDPAGNKQVPVSLADIPVACRQATIATEDSRFYQHPGIDIFGIARAIWQNWRTGESISGTSTLTQQLARNLYLSASERTERSLRRKLREAWLAWRLERAYSKDGLLALYLNTTYYGHYAVGIEAAAQAYFGMHARELDLAQCALLAGLPQYPAGYNPVENPDAARRRQAVVLGLMVKHGAISASQAEDAGKEQLAFASTPFPIEAPHFVMWVQSQLETLLGRERLAAGGLRVTTTLDLDWQRQAEAIVRRRLAQLQPCAAGAPVADCDPGADPARRVDNAALIALDPHTGAILAMVGSPDYFDPGISGALNATLALRQPGSAIKPLTYATALDPARARQAGRQPWTAATIIPDLRASFLTAEGQPYVPQNYDRKYHGPVTVRTALANSYNIPAVKTLDAIGVDALIDQAARLGIPWERGIRDWGLPTGQRELRADPVNIQSPIPDTESPSAKFGLALTLGGGEVSLLDLTAAYAAFANGGVRAEPFAISKVTMLDGKILFEQSAGEDQDTVAVHTSRTTQHAARTALDPRVAYLITDILSDNAARIPAFGKGNWLEIGRPAAAKTGTTTDWRDNWTVGYTPGLAAGVWVGNADNTPMKDVSGITGAGPIWHDFMAAALRDSEPQPFPRPDGLVRVEVCADSGLLPPPANGDQPSAISHQLSAISHQPSAISYQPSAVPCPNRRSEWFIAGTEPTEIDRSHVQLAVDVRTGGPAQASTPADDIRIESYWQLPAQYQAWARENGVPQLAKGNQGEEERRSGGALDGSSASPLKLTSPDPNRVYRLDPGLPAGAQQVPVTALPEGEIGDLTLLVDGMRFAALPGPDYTAWWTLSRGKHTFQAIATQKDGARTASEAVVVFVEQASTYQN